VLLINAAVYIPKGSFLVLKCCRGSNPKRGFRDYVLCAHSSFIGIAGSGKTLKESLSLKKDKTWLNVQGGLTGKTSKSKLMAKREHSSNKDATCYSEKTLKGMTTP
jgi:hypothetical protein